MTKVKICGITSLKDAWASIDAGADALGFVFYAKNHEDNYISLNGLLNAWYAFNKNLSFRVRDYEKKGCHN